MEIKDLPVINEILPELYRAEIPLPLTPLKALNSYIIKGQDRNLIIDTGMDDKICIDAMAAVINRLHIDLDDTDFFISHSHIDHIGLLPVIASKSSRVYFNKYERDHISRESLLSWAEKSAVYASNNGYKKSGIEEMVADTSINEKPFPPDKFTILQENDQLKIGRYSLTVLETPGHSRGHMCLYEPEHKILFSGDHILNDITPNISSRFNDEENPLQEYLSSLDKVYSLDAKIVLPGHRTPPADLKTRIDELKNHHMERLNEILSILNKKKLNAFQVASLMTWDMKFETWEDFPIYPKWFAFSEALSHLHYLESIHKVRRLILSKGQILLYNANISICN